MSASEREFQVLRKPPNGFKIKLISLEVLIMARKNESPQKAAVRDMISDMDVIKYKENQKLS